MRWPRRHRYRRRRRRLRRRTHERRWCQVGHARAQKHDGRWAAHSRRRYVCTTMDLVGHGLISRPDGDTEFTSREALRALRDRGAFPWDWLAERTLCPPHRWSQARALFRLPHRTPSPARHLLAVRGKGEGRNPKSRRRSLQGRHSPQVRQEEYPPSATVTLAFPAGHAGHGCQISGSEVVSMNHQPTKTAKSL